MPTRTNCIRCVCVRACAHVCACVKHSGSRRLSISGRATIIVIGADPQIRHRGCFVPMHNRHLRKPSGHFEFAFAIGSVSVCVRFVAINVRVSDGTTNIPPNCKCNTKKKHSELPLQLTAIHRTPECTDTEANTNKKWYGLHVCFVRCACGSIWQHKRICARAPQHSTILTTIHGTLTCYVQRNAARRSQLVGVLVGWLVSIGK